MAALTALTLRQRILLRATAFLCGAAVTGVPVAHALTEPPRSGGGIEAEHTTSCRTLHGTELCVAAAGVLIARPACDPGVHVHPPVARDVRLDP
ncbi:MAG: hypothetical protein IH616_24355, partial [Gemmatimonadales bacterium]|nr:hypothetical protein [Gemmatimonadales bacterium]